MSEKLFRFLLSELEIIRIRCTIANCSGVVEMKVVNLKTAQHMRFVCPVCGNGSSSAGSAGIRASGPDALGDLGDAIDTLKSTAQANHFEVEFVLLDPDAPKMP
jgi:hypothetical protein